MLNMVTGPLYIKHSGDVLPRETQYFYLERAPIGHSFKKQYQRHLQPKSAKPPSLLTSA